MNTTTMKPAMKEKYGKGPIRQTDRGDARRAFPLEPAHKPTMLVNRDVPGKVQTMVTAGKRGERLGPVENFDSDTFDNKMFGRDRKSIKDAPPKPMADLSLKGAYMRRKKGAAR